MAKSRANTDTAGDWLVRVLCAATAAWVAINLYGILFADYANARLWETWFTPGTPTATWAPVVTIGLITGVIVGVVIGLVFPRQAIKVAIIAAVLQLLATAVSGALASAIVIAAGLVLGAVPARERR
jgi:uncharacterized membrane protein